MGCKRGQGYGGWQIAGVLSHPYSGVIARADVCTVRRPSIVLLLGAGGARGLWEAKQRVRMFVSSAIV